MYLKLSPIVRTVRFYFRKKGTCINSLPSVSGNLVRGHEWNLNKRCWTHVSLTSVSRRCPTTNASPPPCLQWSFFRHMNVWFMCCLSGNLQSVGRCAWNLPNIRRGWSWCIRSTNNDQTNWRVLTRHLVQVVYTGCNRRKGPDFGRVFLMLNYTEKP